MKATGFDAFSSRLALGSLWLVATFLALCGFHNIFPFVEALVRSSTWAALVAVPVLVVAYSLGAIVSGAVLLLGGRPEMRRREHLNFVIVARTGTPSLATRYEALSAEADFLRALFPTMIALSASVMWSASRLLLGENRLASILAAVIVLAAAPLTRVLARRVDEDLQRFVDATQELQDRSAGVGVLPNSPMQPSDSARS